MAANDRQAADSAHPADAAPGSQPGRESANAVLAGLLASGMTLKDAADKAGISERTARRRWRNLRFRAHVQRLQADMVSRALGRMADGMAEAAEGLRTLLNSASKEAVRLGAARSLIELGVRLRESTELEARIRALEQAKAEEDKASGKPRRSR